MHSVRDVRVHVRGTGTGFDLARRPSCRRATDAANTRVGAPDRAAAVAKSPCFRYMGGPPGKGV